MRSVWVAFAAGTAVRLSGCGTQAASIADVQFDVTSSKLQVIVNTCNEDVVVWLSESDEIGLSAEVPRRWRPSGADAYQDLIPVGLEERVGERAVVDSATGREFAPAPAAG